MLILQLRKLRHKEAKFLPRSLNGYATESGLKQHGAQSLECQLNTWPRESSSKPLPSVSLVEFRSSAHAGSSMSLPSASLPLSRLACYVDMITKGC